MLVQATLAPIESVALFFLRRKQNVERVDVPLPDSTSRPTLKVDGAFVAVHPKSYVALYRNERKHGLREQLLRFYAEQNFAVGMVETDSGTLALADAGEMLDASTTGRIPGAFGAAESTCFVPRRVFQLYNLATGALLVNPEA